MAKPPDRYRASDPHSVAEAAFRKATTRPVEAAPDARKPSLPGVKELVSLRLDQDVLAHFQDEGPGWQDRINAALRRAAGLDA